MQLKRNHGASKDDGIEAEIHTLQMELEEAKKNNQRRAHVLGSQNEELNVCFVHLLHKIF